jgi:membrane-associated phospholipid phosphatase
MRLVAFSLFVFAFVATSRLAIRAQDIGAQDEDRYRSESPASGRALGNGRSADRRNDPGADPGADPENRLIVPFAEHLMRDQQNFWNAPRRLRVKDLEWIAPFAGLTAAFVAGDSWISKQVPANFVRSSKTISDSAAYSLVGLSAGSFLWGRLRSDEHLTEAGLLTGEAAINSTATAYLLKEAFRRQRPYQGTEQGTFFQGGNSFPSEHSAAAWPVASVWAHEYPGTLSQALAYGLASAVTLTRVTSKQHFASDALLGSVLGWYFGREAYRAHHDVDLGGAAWGNAFDSDLPKDFAPEGRRTEGRRTEDLGSSYVPIDSWVYPAFDRLIALGLVQSAYVGLRPWTRLECARLLAEAAEAQEEAQETEKPQKGNRYASRNRDVEEKKKTFAALAEEFAAESHRLDGAANQGASLDSIYARTTSIAGTPLRDGYHFGQSLVNDYGRPYAQGFNAVSGVTTHAEAGPFSVSLQAEYQHAPAVASDPLPVLEATAAADSTLPLPNGVGEINRLRLLQGAVGLTFNGIEFSFGQQSLWLGPGRSGPFLFSNNSEPMTMLRIDSVSPYEVPLLSRVLGPVRSEFFLGRLSGQSWEFSPPQLLGPNLPSQPFLHGTKFSFHPTPNLEFGMGFTAQFGGTGNPFTWNSFLKTFYAHSGASSVNPAKRLSEFDFSYRFPGLRNWLQVYTDSMVIDEYSPIGSTRPAINPGLYLSRMPKLPQVDLRLEGVTDDLNLPAHFGAGATYSDVRYRSGYTNNGNLIGSWVGRQGRGEQGWLTCHLSPRRSVQFGYRHNSVDKVFLAGGELRDLTLRADWALSHEFGVGAIFQQESWHFPLLFPAPRSDVITSFQLTLVPGRKRKYGN